MLEGLARRPLQRDVGRGHFLEILERGNHQEIITARVARSLAGLTLSELISHTGWTADEVQEAAKQACASGELKRVAAEPLVLLATPAFTELQRKIIEKVESHRQANPLQPGMAREALRASLGRRLREETFRGALNELSAQGKLEVHGEMIKPAGAQVTLLPEESVAKDQIEKTFRGAGLAVPEVQEVLAGLAVEARRAEKLLRILLQERNLLRVSPDLIFHREALANLKGLLATYKNKTGARISVPAFKELAGISRKYAIPLLEYLDRERVTKRAGDERVIL